MPSATTPLPSDPHALHALVVSLQDELALKDRELHAKMLHIEKLRATLALMKRARFGRTSEKIDQLELLIGTRRPASARPAAAPA